MSKLQTNVVVVFYGSGDTGKTTVLNIVINKLHNLGAKICFDDRRQRVRRLGAPNDRITVLEYQGHMIAVSTSGDSKAEIAKGISKLSVFFSDARKQCDCLICSSRTNKIDDTINSTADAKTKIFISNIAVNKNEGHINVPKSTSELRAHFNEWQAFCLLRTIEYTNDSLTAGIL